MPSTNPDQPVLELRIALTTSDYERSVKFYCEGLGIEPAAIWNNGQGKALAAGNAMIGLWLIVLSYSALRGNSFPQSLAIFGLISAVILALGLVAIPGIFRGIDSKEYEFTLFNSIWWTSSLGYLALLPTWSIFLGRFLLRQ